MARRAANSGEERSAETFDCSRFARDEQTARRSSDPVVVLDVSWIRPNFPASVRVIIRDRRLGFSGLESVASDRSCLIASSACGANAKESRSRFWQVMDSDARMLKTSVRAATVARNIRDLS